MGVEVVYLSSTVAAEVTYFGAAAAAYKQLSDNLTAAEDTFDAEYCRLTSRYQEALSIVHTGGTVDAEFYENGASSLLVQVCFVAGTKIRFKNGETKTIEELKRGDFPRAAMHDDPTGEINDFEIVELYENETDRLVEILFVNMENGTRFSTKSTPEHPFFVYGKGWTAAEKIQTGDECRSASNKQIAVVSVTYLEESCKVYNFQVKSAHTYFVGDSDDESVLVHNDCPDCGKKSGWFGADPHLITACPVKMKQAVDQSRAQGAIAMAPVDGVVTHDNQDANNIVKKFADSLPVASQMMSMETVMDEKASKSDKFWAWIDLGTTFLPLFGGGSPKSGFAKKNVSEVVEKIDLAPKAKNATPVIKVVKKESHVISNVVDPNLAEKAAENLPDFRQKNFSEWFNNMTGEAMQKIWGDKKAQDRIKENLRAPGGMHEWLPVSRAPKFREWGVTEEQIKILRTKIDDIKFVNPPGTHVSTKPHNEIIALVDKATSFEEFKSLLRSWAEIRLPNGISDLPIGLR